MKYDLIVAGAGVAGCFLAARVSQAGYRVALVDARPKNKIGNTWEVTVNKSSFNTLGIKFPDNALWEEEPEATVFYAKDINTNVKVKRDSFNLILIKHKILNQHFLESALASNIDFYTRHKIASPIIENNWCAGVTGLKSVFLANSPFKLKAGITADCTGARAVLRKNLPAEFNIKREVRVQDYASAWQEIWTVDGSEILNDVEKKLIGPGICYTKIGKYHAFSSLHLRKNNTMNMIFASSVSKDNLAYFICQKHIKDKKYLKKKLSAGGGIIPIRRSLDNLVGNGFLLVGDSACQVIPTMGSGIEASLIAADIAAKTIIHSLNEGISSQKFLWQYNVEYQEKIGAILASYDIIRRFIQSVTVGEMNDIFKSGLIKDKNFVTTYSTSEISYNISSAIDNIKKIFTNPQLLPVILRFIQALSDSKKALELYLDYPKSFNADEFVEWQEKTNLLFSNYRTF
jgi:flavin-dependent dehydrogenase